MHASLLAATSAAQQHHICYHAHETSILIPIRAIHLYAICLAQLLSQA
jgi:hypothetical protein